jgi:hypothetical protein
MAKGADMKVNMTADNSDLVKKSRESKQALKDFEKVGDDALSRLGEAFGVNTGKIEQMSSALRGLGTKMSESGNAGTAAFGKLLTSVGGLSTAIAGIGIGAIVTGFKMLNDEAENFKSTVAGANMEMATAAYIDTYRQVIHDFNREIGQGTAEAQSSWKKFWGTIGAGMRAAFQTGAVAGAAAPGDFNNQALVTYNNLLTEAGQKARTAEEISNEMYQVTRQMSDKAVEWARMEREIAEYKRIAYDKTSSTAQQQEALNKAVELITQKYGEQAELQGKLADLQEEFNSLAESSVADIDKANQLRVQAENVTASMNNALRELSERQASVAANAQKEAQARKEALAAAQAMAAARANLQGWDGSISSENNLKESLPTQVVAPDAGIAVPVTPVLDASAVTDITNELQSVLTSAFDSIGSALGSLIGDLITGEDAWGNFGNAALSAFGDMATTIGKMAISIGVATLAIQGSLTTLNGWAAIAAGTALVALGMAVKTGLSNIASGNYSASASVATSGNYGSSTNVGMAFDQRELNIKVSGKLYASGNQIMAVIENENNRINHTT